MTEEQFKKAAELNKRICELEGFVKDITALKAIVAYCYADYIGDVYGVSNHPKAVRDILKRHEVTILQEIDDEIQKLKSEIEAI